RWAVSARTSRTSPSHPPNDAGPGPLMVRRVWEDVPGDEPAALRLASSAGLPPVVARLLCQRGLADPEEARAFLEPSLTQLHDPFLLSGMRAAVDRILAAVARRERIAIHG